MKRNLIIGAILFVIVVAGIYLLGPRDSCKEPNTSSTTYPGVSRSRPTGRTEPVTATGPTGARGEEAYRAHL